MQGIHIKDNATNTIRDKKQCKRSTQGQTKREKIQTKCKICTQDMTKRQNIPT
jgi:hypothetical protein